MRQNRQGVGENSFSILTVDDDPLMTSTLQTYFRRSGYRVDVENDPVRAVERVRCCSYDILLLDFLMTPICGDRVVAEIRQFNQEIFIILLTGHKSMAPPIRTIRELDIQGYYEKSERFDQLELLVESCTKSIVQMRTIRGYQKGLDAMMQSLTVIYSLRAAEHIADEILKTAVSVLGCERSALALEGPLVPDGGKRDGFFIRYQGEQPHIQDRSAAELMQRLHGVDYLSFGRQVYLPVREEGKRQQGFLMVEYAIFPSQVQVQLAKMFVRQISVAIQNAGLHSLIQEKNEALAAANGRMKESYTEMVSAIRLMVDAKDEYTCGHSDRVAYFAELIARQLGRDEMYCQRVRIAGLFHDVGKMSIPDSILLKESHLTEEEYQAIQRHSEAGASILGAMSQFRDIAQIVRAHHECYNGKGYPDGLAREEIPEEAMIISVADSYDAMTSDRRYRGSLGALRAREEIQRCRGSQFAPFVVDAFFAIPPELLEVSHEMLEEEIMSQMQLLTGGNYAKTCLPK